MLKTLILGQASRARCTVVVQSDPVRPSVTSLRSALAASSNDDRVAYAIRLDTPILARLATVVTIRFQLRVIEKMIGRSGGLVIGRYGVDPSVDAPVCVFDLNSPAADYAARCLRPRGSSERLRRVLARCFGCDPALGGIVVVARARCS